MALDDRGVARDGMEAERLQFAEALDQALGGSELVVQVIVDWLGDLAVGQRPSTEEIRARRAICQGYLNSIRDQRMVIRLQIEKAGTQHG